MLTIKEIAEICGVSERAVRKYCERNHIGTYRNLGSVKRRNLSEPDIEALFRHYGVEVPIHRNLSEPGAEPVSEPIGTTSEPGNAPKSVPWEVYEDLRRQLEVKDGQIADLSAALVAAQETAKAAQALHAADKAEAMAIEPAEMKKGRWQRLKEAWRGGGGD